MLKTKKSKTHRMRGTSSHGWGHKKKHRGAGHRGGKGLSGTGARGDAQKSGILSNSKGILRKISASKGVKLSKVTAGNSYFGKRGFKSVHKKKTKVMSVTFIENHYDELVEMKAIEKNTLDTTKLGVDKILGRGKFSRKITVIANDISDGAKASIIAGGGKVEVIKVKDEFEEDAVETETEEEEE